jgi:hypothetical protein
LSEAGAFRCFSGRSGWSETPINEKKGIEGVCKCQEVRSAAGRSTTVKGGGRVMHNVRIACRERKRVRTNANSVMNERKEIGGFCRCQEVLAAAGRSRMVKGGGRAMRNVVSE